jgi:hypothetical protein
MEDALLSRKMKKLSLISIFLDFLWINKNVCKKYFFWRNLSGLYELRRLRTTSITSVTWSLPSSLKTPFRLRKVKPWVLLRKFHRRTNLTALLVTISGSRNKLQKRQKFSTLAFRRFLALNQKHRRLHRRKSS